MSFFRTGTLSAVDAAQAPRIITQLRAGEIDAVLVRGIYDRATCATVCEELEAGAHGLIRTDFPAKFAAFFYGINLNLAHPDLNDYFAAAPRFRHALARLHGGDLDLEGRVCGLLSALDQGFTYAAPPGPDPGLEYMFTTIRAHLPGGYIPPHFDDEQAARPSYRQLMPLIGSSLFSFVLGLSQAEEGGALEVFNLRPDEPGQPIARNDRSAARRDLEGVESVRFRLDPGDMIVFASGRYLHRVTPVAGARTRWTVCSFMAESRSPGRIFCWG